MKTLSFPLFYLIVNAFDQDLILSVVLGSMTVAPYAMGSNLGEEEDEDEIKRKADYYSALNVWVSRNSLLYGEVT